MAAGARISGVTVEFHLFMSTYVILQLLEFPNPMSMFEFLDVEHGQAEAARCISTGLVTVWAIKQTVRLQLQKHLQEFHRTDGAADPGPMVQVQMAWEAPNMIMLR
jgi:hypothetical protein